jgi:pimeloyl-ACP methyl ester carboxylesterase
MTTFVLVHGAWHGGWCWSRVARILRAQGHEIYTPSLPGMGEHAHLLNRQITLDTQIDDVVALFESYDIDNAVLVGHSFGGLIVTGVADRLHGSRRVARMVYLDALVPRDGEGWFSFHNPERTASFHKSARDTGNNLFLPAPAPEVFGVGADDAAWVAAHLTPHPYGTYLTALALPHLAQDKGAASLQRTYVDCVKPFYSDFNGLKARLKADAAWKYVEIQTGHDAMVTAPEELAALLAVD